MQSCAEDSCTCHADVPGDEEHPGHLRLHWLLEPGGMGAGVPAGATWRSQLISNVFMSLLWMRSIY